MKKKRKGEKRNPWPQFYAHC